MISSVMMKKCAPICSGVKIVVGEILQEKSLSDAKTLEILDKVLEHVRDTVCKDLQRGK